MTETVECGFCKKTADLDTAIDTGWFPSYWYPDGSENLDPTCSDCAFKYLQEGTDGERELRPAQTV
jgi:hypothetical protein